MGQKDIKVETFDINFGADGSTYTLTNDVGDTSKAFIRLNSASDKSSSGPTGSTGHTAPYIGHIGLQLTDSSTITANRSSSTESKVVGEVWRYVGPDGGDNEFIVRGHYSISISGSSASQAVSGISNENDCVPIISGVKINDGSTSNYEYATFSAHMDGSGNVVVSRNNSGTSATVYVSVIEFTGSNWSVGHAISSNHDSSGETLTLNTAHDGSGSTFDVGNWENAWIEASMGGDSNETGLSDCMTLVYPGSNTTTVNFMPQEADSSARNDANGYVHVIKNPNLVVKRANDTNVSEGDGTYGTVSWPSGASTTSDIDLLALEWFVDTSGTGTAHLRGRLGARITDATGTITHWVHRSGNTVQARYGVIDLTNLESSYRTTINSDSYIDSDVGIDHIDSDSYIKKTDIQNTIDSNYIIVYTYSNNLDSISYIKETKRSGGEPSSGVAYWNGEDANDNWMSHDLTTFSNVSIVSGRDGNAFSFNGTSSQAGGDNSNDINTMTVTQRTYSVWFKSDGTSGTNFQTIWKEGGSTNSMGIYIYDDALYFCYGDSHSMQDYMTTSFTDTSNYHHLWIIFDTTGGHKMYLDNSLVDSSSDSTQCSSHSGDWSMGYSDGTYFNHTGSASTGDYFAGDIDSFKIWNSVLTDANRDYEFGGGLESNLEITRLGMQESLDSLLVVDVSGSSTESVTINSGLNILSSIEETIDTDTYILNTSSDTLDSSSNVLTSLSDTLDSDTNILSSNDSTIQSSSYVLDEGLEGSIETTSLILATSDLEVDSNSYVLKESSESLFSNYSILTSDTDTIASQTYILNTESTTLSLDSHILISEKVSLGGYSVVLRTHSTDIDSVLVVEVSNAVQKTINSDSTIFGPVQSNISSDSFIVSLGTVTYIYPEINKITRKTFSKPQITKVWK